MEHVVTSSRHTSYFPDRKISITVYNIMQMLICWQYWNINHVLVHTEWEFKIQSHIQLEVFSKAEQNIQGSESDKDCRSANDPKSQTIQPKRHAENLRLDPTDIRGSLCGWNGILSLSCQSQCLALAYLKRLWAHVCWRHRWRLCDMLQELQYEKMWLVASHVKGSTCLLSPSQAHVIGESFWESAIWQ